MGIVLITGCSGFVGRAAARSIARSHKVIGLDGHAPGKVDPLAEFVPMDLTSDASVASALTHVAHGYGHRITCVLHLAAHYDFSGEPSPLYEAVTIRGTERLLEELERFEVEQLVYASTMLVHAPSEPGTPIRESSPIDPKWEYPKSKWATEELIRQRADVPRHAVLRIAGVYDDGCHSPTLANQAQRIFERRLVSRVFPGDPSRGQAFVHLDDLVDLFERLLERRQTLDQSETFLVGEPETLGYDELQRAFGQLIHGEDWTTAPIPKALAKAGAWVEEQRPGEEPFIKPWMIDLADDHFELDISRAKEKLGWNPSHGLRATLPEMVRRLREDPARFYRENELEAPDWLEAEFPTVPPARVRPTG